MLHFYSYRISRSNSNLQHNLEPVATGEHLEPVVEKINDIAMSVQQEETDFRLEDSITRGDGEYGH